MAYIYKNQDAINHMFRVGTGLDSQILGDFEIISQLKVGFNQSKEVGLVNSFLERLVNCVIQASKKVKTETEISSGATSVSFASVQYIIKNVQDVSNKNKCFFIKLSLSFLIIEWIIKLKYRFAIMEAESRTISLTKSFNPSSPPNPPDKEQDWD